MWRQDEKNSVRLLRVAPVCMIFTFSIRHSLHFLEEAVKALAVAMIFHLMV